MKNHNLLAFYSTKECASNSFFTFGPNLEYPATHWSRMWLAEGRAKFFNQFEDVQQVGQYSSWECQSFNLNFKEKVLNNLTVQIPGDHTRENAALAVIAATFFNRVEEQHIRSGLEKNDILPARLEKKTINKKNILFDVCHNVEGAKAFVETTKKYLSNYKNIYVLTAIMKDKPYNEMIKETNPDLHPNQNLNPQS